MDNEAKNGGGRGIRMSHIFVAVVGLHAVVIGGGILYTKHTRDKERATAVARPEPEVETLAEPKPKIVDLRPDNVPTEEDGPAVQTSEAAGDAPVDSEQRTAAGSLVAGRAGGAKPAPGLRPAQPVKTAATPAPATASNEYVVCKGDTLSKIARRLKVPVQALIEANAIKDPGKLSIGMRLKVPTTVTRSAPPKDAARPTRPEEVALNKR